jgi:carboxypeptidase family protein/TonB-dependent receptor-like protein
MRRTVLRFATVLVVAALWLVPAAASAQPAQVGQIAGQIVDTSGGVLPGVAVTATSQDRGFTRTATTDEAGRYVFPAIPIGLYSISAELQGFQTVKLNDNLVETEKTTRVDIQLKVGSLTDQVTVVGETPIVDATNPTVETRVRNEEFEKLAVGRSYQALLNAAPGVVSNSATGTTGNVNAHGALSGNNAFLFDGVDTTDPTTGTFGTNLNFESIQEIVVNTSAVSAEYGRAVGAIVNVITKSGTNTPAGSYKFLTVNDAWDADNKTKSETTGASLNRTKFDQVNPTHDITGGGPIVKDNAWFFTTYEFQKTTSPQRQTVGPVPEDYQQSTKSKFWLLRLSGRLSDNQTAWFKYHRSPTNGFVIDYWGGAGERKALTAQDQGARTFAFQWAGVFRSNWTADATYADNDEFINVEPFELSTLDNGAPHENLADGKYYNGATFDGFVKRPRRQFNASTTLFKMAGSKAHSLKGGFDWQEMKSSNLFAFPSGSYFIDDSFDQVSRGIARSTRRDYDVGASTSKGQMYALYFRDKFELGKHLFAEAGVRYEHQGGTSDVGVDTLGTNTISPRLSATYDLAGNGKTVVVGSYGRFYQGIIQDFSDSFAGIPQQENYNNFAYNPLTGQYVPAGRVDSGANGFQPDTKLRPVHLDEVTVGMQRQIGQRVGIGVRAVFRTWGDIIDDVRSFNPDGTTSRTVVNYDPAKRSYKGIEFTFDKRLSNNWNAAANYTYGRTEGNHFQSTFTSLGDYIDATCRTTADPGIGTNGVIPCSEVQNGANKTGHPDYDRPHALKFSGAYTRPFGPVNLTAGLSGRAVTKRTFTKQRTVNVLSPVDGSNIATATYFYEPLGSDRVKGMDTLTDFAVEGGWKPWRNVQGGVKIEIFNVFNSQDKVQANNLTYCSATTGVPAACAATRTPGSTTFFGAATARGSFQLPRSFRYSLIFRF